MYSRVLRWHIPFDSAGRDRKICLYVRVYVFVCVRCCYSTNGIFFYEKKTIYDKFLSHTKICKITSKQLVWVTTNENTSLILITILYQKAISCLTERNNEDESKIKYNM